MVLISVVCFGISHAQLEIVRLCNRPWNWGRGNLHIQKCVYMDMDQCLVCHMPYAIWQWHTRGGTAPTWDRDLNDMPLTVCCAYALYYVRGRDKMRLPTIWYRQSESSVPYLHPCLRSTHSDSRYVRTISNASMALLDFGGLVAGIREPTMNLIRWSTVTNTRYVREESMKVRITEYGVRERKRKETRQHWIHHSCISA